MLANINFIVILYQLATLQNARMLPTYCYCASADFIFFLVSYSAKETMLLLHSIVRRLCPLLLSELPRWKCPVQEHHGT